MKLTYNAEKNEITIDGEKVNLSESLKLRNHSPSGFSFGYMGSGCAQSALAILLHVTDEETALRLYQEFKVMFVASLPQHSFEIEFDARSWVLGKTRDSKDFDHSLVIASLRDARARCSCGHWEMTAPTSANDTNADIRARIYRQFNVHTRERK
jgi:hypothetical protein